MLRHLVALIAPPRCGVCSEECHPSEPVCSRCATNLAATLPLSLRIPGVDQAWAATRYEGTARQLVAALKFGGRLAVATVAAEALASALPADATAAGELVPVPPDPWRLRIRGFDPGALIAGQLAGRLGLPLSHCLWRPHRPRQVGKARAERLAGDLGLRAVAAPPSRAILVDDVVTTGATLAACARALRARGAERVLAAAFARA